MMTLSIPHKNFFTGRPSRIGVALPEPQRWFVYHVLVQDFSLGSDPHEHLLAAPSLVGAIYGLTDLPAGDHETYGDRSILYTVYGDAAHRRLIIEFLARCELGDWRWFMIRHGGEQACAAWKSRWRPELRSSIAAPCA